MLNDCLTWLLYVFRMFWAWLFEFDIFNGVSFAGFLIGAFVVYKVADNLIIKSS